MSKDRIQWVDYAKGITIIMVVFHHSMFTELYSGPLSSIDSLLVQFRMPFFFFISGLFIRKALFGDLKIFLKSKVALFLYLFILWSIIRYLTDTVPRYFILNDHEVGLGSIFNIFVDPPGGLWFIYALLIFFIIARITRSFPIITLCISLLLFALSSQSGQYEFINQLARFFPIFLLGYLTSQKVLVMAEKIKLYHMAIPVIFLVFTAQTQGAGWSALAVNSFLLSLFGIMSGIIFANTLTRFPRFSFLKYIGQKTLIIYVAHLIPLNILKVILPKVIPGIPELGILIMVLSGVLVPLLIEKVARKIKMDWLFELPSFKRTKHIQKTPKQARLTS